MVVNFIGKDSIKLLNSESFLTDYYELFYDGEQELLQSIESMQYESHNFVIRHLPDTFNVNTLGKFKLNNFFLFFEGENDVVKAEVIA